MKQFSEQSTGVQWGSIAAIIGLLFSGFGATLWAGGDLIIDQKYATDADVKAVQEQVVQQVEQIKGIVETNTRTVQATSASVDGLTLVVLDLRIRELQDVQFDLVSEKTNAGANWSNNDERELLDLRKALSDLNVQRDRLFQRILDRPQ